MRRERNWMNPLPERLLCWMGIIHSPSLRRRPTLKEAITGRATMGMSQKEWEEYYDWLDKMFAEMEEEMTKTITLCDRCGREIKNKPHILKKEDNERNLFAYEICDDCQKELSNWYYFERRKDESLASQQD